MQAKKTSREPDQTARFTNSAMAKADWLATQQDRERSKEASACTKLSFFVSSLGPHAISANRGPLRDSLSPATPLEWLFMCARPAAKFLRRRTSLRHATSMLPHVHGRSREYPIAGGHASPVSIESLSCLPAYGSPMSCLINLITWISNL